MKQGNDFMLDILDWNAPAAQTDVLWRACFPTGARVVDGDVLLTVPFQAQRRTLRPEADADVPRRAYTLRVRAYGDSAVRLTVDFSRTADVPSASPADRPSVSDSPMLELHPSLVPEPLAVTPTATGWDVRDTSGALRLRVNTAVPPARPWGGTELSPPQETLDLTVYPDGVTAVPLLAYDHFFPEKIESLPLAFVTRDGEPHRALFAFHAAPQERFAGTGERFAKLDLAGRTALEEMLGEGALYFDPRSPEELAAANNISDPARVGAGRRLIIPGARAARDEVLVRIAKSSIYAPVDAVVIKKLANVGDVVSNGNVYEQWGREYFGPMSCFAHSVPTYVAIGNHERNAHWFDDFVSQPGNEHWFAFSYGNSRFIILDTNRPYDPNSDQYKWLLKELRSKEFRKAAFRFVFFHHPPYSEQWDSPGYTGEEPVRRYLVPILERYGVDIVFSGHTHDYERGRKLLKDDREIFYIITGGGGSALDKVENKDWDVIQLHKSVYHCVVVDVKGGVLSFKAIGLNGDVVDSFRKVSLDEMARLAGAEKPYHKKQIQAVKDEDLMEDKFTFAVAGDTRSWLTIYQPETWYRIIKELNGIRPDFVMDVGDIISHGYTNDPELLMKEWREYFKAVSTSDIPVLPVAGNHDIWSEMSQMFWRRMIGDLWYSFDYGNSHFIILCSDQARPNYISRISPPTSSCGSPKRFIGVFAMIECPRFVSFVQASSS